MSWGSGTWCNLVVTNMRNLHTWAEKLLCYHFSITCFFFRNISKIIKPQFIFIFLLFKYFKNIGTFKLAKFVKFTKTFVYYFKKMFFFGLLCQLVTFLQQKCTHSANQKYTRCNPCVAQLYFIVPSSIFS